MTNRNYVLESGNVGLTGVPLTDTTWEPYFECKDLMALDRYLELLGIEGKDWCNLPRKTLVKAQ